MTARLRAAGAVLVGKTHSHELALGVVTPPTLNPWNPDYVPGGIVLGFDVVSGRPKLLVHLTQAKRQNVALRAEALKLMRVFE